MSRLKGIGIRKYKRSVNRYFKYLRKQKTTGYLSRYLRRRSK